FPRLSLLRGIYPGLCQSIKLSSKYHSWHFLWQWSSRFLGAFWRLRLADSDFLAALNSPRFALSVDPFQRVILLSMFSPSGVLDSKFPDTLSRGDISGTFSRVSAKTWGISTGMTVL